MNSTMPTIQRKYIPTVGLTDFHRSTKQAWSAADFVVAAYTAAETNRIAEICQLAEPTAILPARRRLFANQIDQLNAILTRNASPVNYGQCFTTSAESMGFAGDLHGISAVLRRFQQLPPLPWARVNAGRLTWSGLEQAFHDISHIRPRLLASWGSTMMQTQVTAVSRVLKNSDDDTIDWDAGIGTPPVRPSRTVQMRFVRGAAPMPRLRDDPYS
jgi:hypothetical protein